MASRDGLRKCRGACERRLPYKAYSRGKAKRQRLSTVCNECKAARQLERERWTKMGRACSRCGETRECPAQISMAQKPICVPCQRERHRVKELERRRRPEVKAYYREQMKRWRTEHREQAQEAQRRYRKRIYADPEKAQEWRDYNRMYHRMWRERKGIKVRTISVEDYRKVSERSRSYMPAVPAPQLAATVNRMIRFEDTEPVCERLGISSRTLRDWNDGSRDHAQFDVADRVLTRAGLFWWDVWDETNTDPAELHKVAEAFEGVAVAA